MNNDRRATIQEAAALIAAGAEKIREGRDLVDGVKDEEKEALEAMPDGLKAGDRGQEMEAAVSYLEEAVDGLDSLGFDTIGRALEEATGRDVAEMPDSTLDAVTAEARRWDRLPPWAKAEIDRLKAELASVTEKACLEYGEPGPDSYTVQDYFNPHQGRAIPFERIMLRGIVIEIAERGTGITLTTNQGGLLVIPHVSNTITVDVRDRR